MKKTLLLLLTTLMVYSCSTTDPEPQTIYVDRIVEVEKLAVTPESAYPDSLKWFIKNDSAVYYSILHDHLDQGLTVISYGNHSRAAICGLTGTNKTPWNCITVITYRYTETNGNLDMNSAEDFIISQHGKSTHELGYGEAYWAGSGVWNPDFYSDGQIIISSSVLHYY